METLYRELLGDTLLSVSKAGAWYTIKAGTQTNTTRGKASAQLIYATHRNRIVAGLKNIPAPNNIRSDVGKLLAEEIQKGFEKINRIKAEEIPNRSDDLKEHYADIARRNIVHSAARTAVAYAILTQRTRGKVPEGAKTYYQELARMEHQIVPPHWQSYYTRLVRYGIRTIENITKEGGVNQAWGQ